MSSPDSSPLLIRTTITSDIPIIDTSLIAPCLYEMVQRFGSVTLEEIITASVLPLTITTQDGTIVGFVAFADTPPKGLQAGGMTASKWPQWFAEHYRSSRFTIANSVWLTLFATSYSPGPQHQHLTERVMHHLFRTLPSCDGVLAVLPYQTPIYHPLAELFELVSSSDPSSTSTPRIYTCARNFFIPELNLRAARIEDHDDLVPIFDAQSEVLTSIYGEFFLADLIENAPEGTHNLVADVHGRAIGLMSLTDRIDTSLLIRCFDLEPYDDLMKRSTAEEAVSSKYPQLAGQIRRAAPCSASLTLSRVQRIYAALRTRARTQVQALQAAAGVPLVAASTAVSPATSRGPSRSGSRRSSGNQTSLLSTAISKLAASATTTITASPKAETARLLTRAGSSQSPSKVPSRAASRSASRRGSGSGPSGAAAAGAMGLPVTGKQFVTGMGAITVGDPRRGLRSGQATPNARSRAGSPTNANRTLSTSTSTRTLDKDISVVNIPSVGQQLKTITYEILESYTWTLNENAENTRQLSIAFDTWNGIDGKTLNVDTFIEQLAIFHSSLKSSKLPSLIEFIEEKVATELKPLQQSGNKAKERETNDAQDDADEIDADAHRMSQDNAFCITLFCLDSAYDAHGLDFLRPAFDLFADRDYCIITLPHTAAEPPLLQWFTRIPPTASNTFGHVMYLLHRDAVHASPRVRVRWVRDADDITAIGQLTMGMEQAHDVMQQCKTAWTTTKQAIAVAKGKEEKEVDVEDVMNNLDRVCLIVECLSQVIGVILCSPTSPSATLRADYAIESFISSSLHTHAQLNHFILNPLFSRSTSFIIREVLRLYHRDIIYITDDGNIPPLLHLAVQVRPRRQPIQSSRLVTVAPTPPAPALPPLGTVVSSVDNESAAMSQALSRAKGVQQGKIEDGGIPPNTSLITGTSSPETFALHMLTRHLLTQPKLAINARVVVIGASDTALSLLEHLLLTPTRNYASLTLLSRDGLPNGRTTHGYGHFLSSSSCYDHLYLSRLRIASRVRILKGECININARQKMITLGDGSGVPYDYLVMTMGLQDQTPYLLFATRDDKPTPTSDGEDKIEEKTDVMENNVVEQTSSSFTSSILSAFETDVSTTTSTTTPIQGIFPMSTEEHIAPILSYYKQYHPRAIIIYGCDITALTTIRGLLDYGVPSTHLLWVYPVASSSAAWCAHDKLVGQRMLEGLSTAGVKSLSQTMVQNVRATDGRITHVLLRRVDENHKEGEDDKEEKTNNDVEEEEINFSMDCHLLIGVGHMDIDRCMFQSISANSLVYDGRLVVDAHFQTVDPCIFASGSACKFSRRYGETLALQHYDSVECGQQLAQSILSAIDPTSGGLPPRKYPPILGTRPKTTYAVLPGGLHYLHTVHPTLRTMTRPKVLLTKTQASTRITRLVFDDDNILHSITYIGTHAIPVPNLIRLIGMPSTYMNRILFRYEQNQITDLMDFLSSTWATALYHESFDELRAKGNIWMRENQKDIPYILDQVIGLKTAQEELSDPFSISRLTASLPQHVRDQIQLSLLQFLEKNSNHLPGYTIPETKPVNA